MIARNSVLFSLVLAFLLACPPAFAGVGGETPFEAIFPQVARGEIGVAVETRIVLTNPRAEATLVRLDSFDPDLLPPTEFELAGGETRTVEIAGADLRVGWVRVSAARSLSAAAIITTRQPGTGAIVARASVLAQIPGSRFVFPVFRDSESQEDTGVAVADLVGVDVTLTLLDDDGAVVGERVLRHANRLDAGDFQQHFAMFVSQLFPELPADFSSGSLLVSGREPLARTIAVTALYTRGPDLLAAPVLMVDVPAQYLVELEPGEGLDAAIEALGQQYGFEVVERVTQNIVLVLTEEERARAVARDPRVRSVRANGLIP